VKALLDKSREAGRSRRAAEALDLANQAVATARALQDNVGVTDALARVGSLLVAQQRISEGIARFQESLDLAQSTGYKHGEATGLMELGLAHWRNGDPMQAEELYTRSASLFRTLGDAGGEGAATANLGILYAEADQLPKAIATFTRAVELLRKGDNRQFEANTLYNLGSALIKIGQPGRAKAYLQRAVPILRALNNVRMLDQVLNDLAAVLEGTGQYSESVATFEELLTLARKTGNHTEEGETLANLGNAYGNVGRNDLALKSLQDAIPLLTDSDKSGFKAYALDRYGYFLLASGKLQDGLQQMQKAIEAYRQLNDRGGEAYILEELSAAYSITGQLRLSLDYGQRALAIFLEIGDKQAEANVLTNLGATYVSLHDFGSAIRLLKRALTLHRLQANLRYVAIDLTQLGDIFSAYGRYAQALACFAEAMTCYKSFPNVYMLEAGTTLRMGMADYRAGKFRQALQRYRAALTMHGNALSPGMRPEALNGLADVEMRLGRERDAETHLREATNLLERQRRDMGGLTEFKTGYLSHWLMIYHNYQSILIKHGKLRDAFELSQKTKGRGLLDLLTAGRVDLNRGLSADERAQLDTLRQQADALNAAMVKEGVENKIGSKRRYEALKEQLKQLEDSLQALTDTLYSRHPDLAQRRSAATATVDEITRALSKDTVLLDYSISSARQIRLFTLSSRHGKPSLSVHTVPIHRTVLARLADQLHAACANPRKPYRAESAMLYHLLIRPIERQLRGKRRLIVCPDGVLWDVPFAALRGPSVGRKSGDKRFLGARFEIVYAYSASGAVAAQKLAATHTYGRQGSILIAANPAFGTSDRFGDLKEIPGQRPIDTASRPIDAASRPIDIASRPIDSASRPLDTASRPIDSASRPLDTASRPLDSASRPINSASRPLDSASRPLDTASRPIDSASRPLDIASRAFDTVSRSFGISSRAFDSASRGKAIPPLPGTQREADSLRKLFPDALTLTGDKAQEATIKERAGNYRYLHLATHGFVNDGSPLLSSVVLAKPEANSKEDGFLTAREIYEMNLHTEMTVLSACNTARGENRTGEGIIGLTWALFVAGCPTQVVSQWAVDDSSTALLMQRFYTDLKTHNMGKAQALKEAEDWLRRQKRRYHHPYYWAPFVLYGAWR
jgi:CHAT domain-containing protein/Tfp pilus assembly protein PilF